MPRIDLDQFRRRDHITLDVSVSDGQPRMLYDRAAMPRWQLNGLRQPARAPGARSVNMTSRELLRLVDDPAPPHAFYSAQLPAGTEGEPLLALFDEPDGTVGVWVGGTGTGYDAHVDRPHNFVFERAGHKQWDLFSPADLDALRMGPYGTALFRHSQAPPGAVAPALRVVLAPGDVLFVPQYTPHYVTCLDVCLSVTVMGDWKRLPLVTRVRALRVPLVPGNGWVLRALARDIAATLGADWLPAKFDAAFAATFRPQRAPRFCVGAEPDPPSPSFVRVVGTARRDMARLAPVLGHPIAGAMLFDWLVRTTLYIADDEIGVVPAMLYDCGVR